jgi:hypothetical protein
MSAHVVRTLAQLDDALTLAPERHLATRLVSGDGAPLSTLVTVRSERIEGDDLARAVVFDTTHARDGVLDVRAALRAEAPPSSAKKRVRVGDLLVSRLRPYLRQIAFVHPALDAACDGRPMACSTEFYVLEPLATRAKSASLAFLLPWLLGAEAQAILAAAQEGGHHPRVPREVLLSMRVEQVRLAARARLSSQVERALRDVLDARRRLSRLIEE